MAGESFLYSYRKKCYVIGTRTSGYYWTGRYLIKDLQRAKIYINKVYANKMAIKLQSKLNARLEVKEVEFFD